MVRWLERLETVCKDAAPRVLLIRSSTLLSPECCSTKTPSRDRVAAHQERPSRPQFGVTSRSNGGTYGMRAALVSCGQLAGEPTNIGERRAPDTKWGDVRWPVRMSERG
ncbi:hypothetical protein PsYK624_089730 [Phanerochaete sordida]|uniref:Uncharacterized protein n=1 Tax=Phanerochaete sordida TaxID=48140 RepID=A0A9P3LES1_9APHY|nr:hypothetical protein PsYK624_089730 [Phanerochaete sordida]